MKSVLPESLEPEEPVVPLIRLNVILQIWVWHEHAAAAQRRGRRRRDANEKREKSLNYMPTKGSFYCPKR